MSLEDILTKDHYELPEVYDKRVELTYKIYEKYNLNPVTCMVMGRMLINKMLLNVKYSDDIEKILGGLVF